MTDRAALDQADRRYTRRWLSEVMKLADAAPVSEYLDVYANAMAPVRAQWLREVQAAIAEEAGS